MNLYESCIQRIGKEYYGAVITEIIASDKFKQLLASPAEISRICSSKCKLNLYETNGEDIVSFLVTISRHKYFSFTKIMENLKTCLTDFRRLNDKTILDEIISCLSISLYGTTLSCRYPYFALKEDMGKIIWKETCLKLLNKIKALLRSIEKTEPKDQTNLNYITEICSECLDKLSLIYFTMLLFSIHFLQAAKFPSKEVKYLMYWASFYSSTLGDISNFRKQIIRKKEERKRYDKISTCFYLLGTKIWPQYSKPYHSLALLYLSYENYFMTIYFYSKLFMSLSSEDCFSLARQDFGTIYTPIEEEYFKYNKELKSSKYLSLIDYFQENEEENSLLLFHNNNNFYMFCLKDQKNIVQIKNYRNQYIEIFPSISSIQFTNILLPLIINSLYSSFIYLNLKIIMKYNMDKFIFELQHLSNLLYLLINIDYKYLLSNIFHKILYFPIILIYTINISLNDLKINASNTSPSFSSSISLLLLFTNFIVKLLTKHEITTIHLNSSDHQYHRPLIGYLSIVFKWFEISFKQFPSIIKQILITSILDVNQFCFIDLYNWITIETINIKYDETTFPEFQVFHAAFFSTGAASTTDHSIPTLNLNEENNVSLIYYLAFIKSTIQSFIRDKLILFKIEDNQVYFDDEAYYIEYRKNIATDINDSKDNTSNDANKIANINANSNANSNTTNNATKSTTLSIQDFDILLGNINDYKLLFFLYNFVINKNNNNINKKNECSIYYIRHIIPDTNTFLVDSATTILDVQLFNNMSIILPVLVLREFIGLSQGKQLKEKQDKSEERLNRALLWCDFSKTNTSSNRNIQILSTQGELLKSASNYICEYHDAYQRYDDIILSSVKIYSNSINRSITYGKNKFTVRPLLFITNDMVLRTKSLNCDVLCVSLKIFKKISDMISSCSSSSCSYSSPN